MLLLGGCTSRNSVLGSLFFLKIYINDLLDNLTLNPKLFADDTSLFSTVTDPNDTANQIKNDLHSINTWAYRWKKKFNHDSSNQAHEVIFIRTIKVTAHPQLFFNNDPGLLQNLQNTLPRPSSLLTIYKSFIKPHLDFGDIIYNQAYNMSFQQKVESIQNNEALAIRGAIYRTSKEKLFEKLGFWSF